MNTIVFARWGTQRFYCSPVILLLDRLSRLNSAAEELTQQVCRSLSGAFNMNYRYRIRLIDDIIRDSYLLAICPQPRTAADR